METTTSWVHRLATRLGAQLVETHISWVLLVPGFAYKIKKPVRLPFVDYGTPERRRHFCEEEVRLNRRLAPTLYLGVARITGSPTDPALDGPGPAFEHAVRMRRFAPGALFSEQAEAGTLGEAAVDRLAGRIALFHQHAALADAAAAPHAPDLQARSLAALEGCGALLAAGPHEDLRAWILQATRAATPLLQARRAAGRVRECHGDLHLANIVSLDGEVAAFDCIEFDPALRWIDVIEEVAFTLMDFAAYGQSALGWRFLDGWLERTGDHEGIAVLRPALVYRALVRAQVTHLRDPAAAAARRYARLALAFSRPVPPRLVITHGLPGSGKSYVARQLLQQLGAVRVRSDVERKRLAGLDRLADSAAAGVALYTPEATRATYERLFALARIALRAGFPVVLDAAFLRHDERAAALAVAREVGVPFAIAACKAPLPVLRERLRSRHGDASEADVAVLEQLRQSAEPLRADEFPFLHPLPELQGTAAPSS